jgi:hypothetical protein
MIYRRFKEKRLIRDELKDDGTSGFWNHRKRNEPSGNKL